MERYAPREYKGWLISKGGLPYGWWEAWKPGQIRLRADTLAGIKQLVTHTNRKA